MLARFQQDCVAVAGPLQGTYSVTDSAEAESSHWRACPYRLSAIRGSLVGPRAGMTILADAHRGQILIAGTRSRLAPGIGPQTGHPSSASGWGNRKPSPARSAARTAQCASD
jgi:hypothetical protein